MHTYRNVFEEIFSTSGSEGNGDRRYYDNCLYFFAMLALFSRIFFIMRGFFLICSYRYV